MRIGVAVVAGSILLAPQTAGAQPTPTEYEVKAAYLYNFARFVEWPPEAFPSAETPFVIGVLADSEMAAVLRETVAGKTVRERAVVVREWRDPREVDAHILYLGTRGSLSLPQILRALDRRPVLTVGDMDAFAERGGMIRFLLEQQRVRFDVNRGRLEQAGLSMSSQVLKLARRTLPEGG